MVAGKWVFRFAACTYLILYRFSHVTPLRITLISVLQTLNFLRSMSPRMFVLEGIQRLHWQMLGEEA